ncbi:MAG: hypothetical protein OHK0029_29180 [Armatimonadaceae bacterium]
MHHGFSFSVARSGFLALAALVLLNNGCGGGGSCSNSQGGGTRSNRARFTFDCDLQGVTGVLTMNVEAVGTSGVVFGSGPNPDITGVIGTGGVTYFTAGELRSPVARYIFTGENQFADFTDLGTNQRFRVQWNSWDQGVIMVVNPFGPGPTQQACRRTGARYL